MRNILTQFLTSSALLFTAAQVVPPAEREGAAKPLPSAQLSGRWERGGERFAQKLAQQLPVEQ